MRIFVTGATGHIGSLVVPELIEARHDVVGLARSDRAAAALTAAGAEPQRGDLADLDRLRAAAADADGVIRLAFDHDFSRMAAAARTDLEAIEAIGDALEGTDRPFVVTAGVAGLTPGRVATEADARVNVPDVPRSASESVALALTTRGVRVSIVRLPPVVHGPADAHGFIPRLIGIAREKGRVAYVGDGSNRWPAVHELDAARLFRLAVESAPGGARLHGVGDEGVAFRDIAEVIGSHLDLPVVGISAGEARSHFGFLGMLTPLDSPASSAATRELLGWRPVHPTLLADMDEGHYFRPSS